MFNYICKQSMSMSNCLSSEDEGMEHDVASNELTFLARELRKFPEILSKSQIPSLKAKKDEALHNLLQKYHLNFGKPSSIAKLQKKINNMKTRLKKKTSLHETGNKPISLRPWERELYYAMESELNPSISKIQNCSFTSEPDEKPVLNSSDENNLPPPKKQQKLTARASFIPPPRKNTKPPSSLVETEETKNLSTDELQRLVLLEQLKTTREQRNYYKLKRIMIIKKMNDDPLS